MPITFQSLNRGVVVFGFFNIDVDMLLLDNCFVFADTFCRLVTELARDATTEDHEAQFDAYLIERTEDIGDLMGAIHGVNHQGFIGKVYQRFPFPRTREGFKQRPGGGKNRHAVEAIIASYAVKRRLPFLFASRTCQITIGAHQFDGKSFGQLVRYVWDGGMPGWKDDLRPVYVTAMMEAIERSKNPLFDGLRRNEPQSK